MYPYGVRSVASFSPSSPPSRTPLQLCFPVLYIVRGFNVSLIVCVAGWHSLLCMCVDCQWVLCGARYAWTKKKRGEGGKNVGWNEWHARVDYACEVVALLCTEFQLSISYRSLYRTLYRRESKTFRETGDVSIPLLGRTAHALLSVRNGHFAYRRGNSTCRKMCVWKIDFLFFFFFGVLVRGNNRREVVEKDRFFSP